MTGSPSEICEVERKKSFLQNLLPGWWIGRRGISHVGLTLVITLQKINNFSFAADIRLGNR